MVRSVLALGLAVCLGVATAQLWAAHAARGRVLHDVASVPVHDVALVLGAGLEPDGRPSLMLADRVRGAVELYRRGTVTHLLMSGDNSRAGYDEPTSMRRMAIDAGVPSAAITLDYAGFDTFDSCARAHDIFGVRAAVVVTQDFHATRAVATCRSAGIDAIGLARSTAEYARVDVRALEVRERAATVKAFWDDLSGSRPHYLGTFVGLPGSATLPATNQAFDDELVARR